MGQITRIEMEYMESIKKIAREMSKPKEIDWLEFERETAKAILPEIVRHYPREYAKAAHEAYKYAAALTFELMNGDQKSANVKVEK